ncbi:hypothetical protein SLS54_006671 [Diplodia seriata]
MEAQQKAEEAEKVERELDEQLAETTREIKALARLAEGEKNVESKRRKLAEAEKSLSMARNAFGIDSQVGVQPISSASSMSQSSGRSNPARFEKPRGEIRAHRFDFNEAIERFRGDDEEIPFLVSPKPEGLPEDTENQTLRSNVRRSLQEEQGYTNDLGESKPLGRRGDWSEKLAKEILGQYLEYPLIQTTLNYFESFLTQTMLEELKTTLDKNPGARHDLRELRKSWGNSETDYFLACSESSFERRVRRTLGWNKYYNNGYLISKYGGPKDLKMDQRTYKSRFYKPLFGYGKLHPDPANGDVDSADLTNLYKSFLRTAYCSENPCFSHAAGLLGSKDKCGKCGVVGAVSDLS